jgi:cytochrome c oxidase subunit 2
MRERNILLVTILVLSLIGVGIAVASLVRPLPQAASDRAVLVDQLLRVFFGLATAVFLGVEGLLVFAAVRGRVFGTSAAIGNPNPALELLWLAVPAALVLVLSVYSIRVLLLIEAPRSDPLLVEIAASQYRWDFHYPESGVTTNELHLPAGRPAVLQFRSRDVIHSFWVPVFGGKIDALPDRVTSLALTPLRTGEYQAVCAELCGVGHAGMIASVWVEDPAGFEQWLQSGVGD